MIITIEKDIEFQLKNRLLTTLPFLKNRTLCFYLKFKLFILVLSEHVFLHWLQETILEIAVWINFLNMLFRF